MLSDLSGIVSDSKIWRWGLLVLPLPVGPEPSQNTQWTTIKQMPLKNGQNYVKSFDKI